ncbi:MAG TPA: hypothetical protein P5307_13590 [Pirellulaceae bacterium]|nr:hypothetical protein [Pirellulaceae bacterium]
MKTIETTKAADPDNKLRLEIPVDGTDRPYHVVVMFEQVTEAEEGLGEWPEGFIEATAGAWEGELTRPPQGECDQRQPL